MQTPHGIRPRERERERVSIDVIWMRYENYENAVAQLRGSISGHVSIFWNFDNLISFSYLFCFNFLKNFYSVILFGGLTCLNRRAWPHRFTMYANVQYISHIGLIHVAVVTQPAILFPKWPSRLPSRLLLLPMKHEMDCQRALKPRESPKIPTRNRWKTAKAIQNKKGRCGVANFLNACSIAAINFPSRRSNFKQTNQWINK